MDYATIDNTGGVGDEAAKLVIAAGHPPIADKVILIDFDATIAPFGYLFDFPKPFEGIAEFSQTLHSLNYKIGIFTSRLSPTWLESAGQKKEDHEQYVQDYCNRYGIHFDFYTAEKVPSQAIIDDKAFRFEGRWDEISDEFSRRGWI